MLLTQIHERAMDNDDQLWQQFAAGVTPLKQDKRATPASPKASLARAAPHTHNTAPPAGKIQPAFGTSVTATVQQVLARTPHNATDMRRTGFVLRYNSGRLNRTEMARLVKMSKSTVGRHDVHRSQCVELDLHGMTVAQSKPLLLDTFVRMEQRGEPYLHLIHGKGTAQLKHHVCYWLPQLPFVIAAYSIVDAAGQSGALIAQCKW